MTFSKAAVAPASRDRPYRVRVVYDSDTDLSQGHQKPESRIVFFHGY